MTRLRYLACEYSLDEREVDDGLNRKQYRVKRHSCALCKPNKMGWDHRFKAKERSMAKALRAQIQAVFGRG